MPRRKHRKAAGKRLFKRARRGGPLGGMSQALSGLTSAHAELVAQRNQLDAQIQVVAQALKVIGGGRPAAAGVRRGGRRPRAGRGPRPGSLKSYVLDVLGGGGVMAVKDITAGVIQAGYKTRNKTLAKSVGIALTELPGVKKVGRGKFRLK